MKGISNKILLVLLFLLIAGCKNKITGNTVSDTDDYIKILLSDLSNTAKFYSFNYNVVDIKYFVVLDSNGKPKTAFDACDVCYANKKGYRQQGNYMVCNNCGKTFSIDNLGTENKNPGGCWPGYLPNTIDGNNLIIKKSDLKKGVWRFK